jgi:hypothetical protein
VQILNPKKINGPVWPGIKMLFMGQVFKKILNLLVKELYSPVKIPGASSRRDTPGKGDLFNIKGNINRR